MQSVLELYGSFYECFVSLYLEGKEVVLNRHLYFEITLSGVRGSKADDLNSVFIPCFKVAEIEIESTWKSFD